MPAIYILSPDLFHMFIFTTYKCLNFTLATTLDPQINKRLNLRHFLCRLALKTVVFWGWEFPTTYEHSSRKVHL